MSDKDRSTELHDQGQTDSAEGNGYNAPHSPLEELVYGGDTFKENADYRQGYEHAESQK